MAGDAVFLELVALGLNNVHFVADGVDESAKLRLAALEDVDTTGRKDCGVPRHQGGNNLSPHRKTS